MAIVFGVLFALAVLAAIFVVAARHAQGDLPRQPQDDGFSILGGSAHGPARDGAVDGDSGSGGDGGGGDGGD